VRGGLSGCATRSKSCPAPNPNPCVVQGLANCMRMKCTPSISRLAFRRQGTVLQDLHGGGGQRHAQRSFNAGTPARAQGSEEDCCCDCAVGGPGHGKDTGEGREGGGGRGGWARLRQCC